MSTPKICPETGVPRLHCMKHYECSIDHDAEDPPEIERPEGAAPDLNDYSAISE